MLAGCTAVTILYFDRPVGNITLEVALDNSCEHEQTCVRSRNCEIWLCGLVKDCIDLDVYISARYLRLPYIYYRF